MSAISAYIFFITGSLSCRCIIPFRKQHSIRTFTTFPDRGFVVFWPTYTVTNNVHLDTWGRGVLPHPHHIFPVSLRRQILPYKLYVAPTCLCNIIMTSNDSRLTMHNAMSCLFIWRHVWHCKHKRWRQRNMRHRNDTGRCIATYFHHNVSMLLFGIV